MEFPKSSLYSKTYDSNTDGLFSMANSNSVLVPWKFSDRPRKQIFIDILGKVSYFIMGCMLCIIIRIASPKQFLRVHSTYHYYIEDRKDIPKLYSFAS